MRLSAIRADITKLDVDAIVNAANESLLGGGGVDGAIHRAAGPELLEECRAFGGCPTGEARITRGYRLPARHVIHTVGPVWQGRYEQRGGAACLVLPERRRLAERPRPSTVAFPCISTGVYGYPVEAAALVAVAAVRSAVEAFPVVEDVTFCCFSEETSPSTRGCSRAEAACGLSCSPTSPSAPPG